ncbi:Hydrogenase transcriptional regulatory protein HoxA [Paramagnetospirillum magnetotacticum MS-1]|uniref:Hydrogenase transcriptional regulatory protein HoxA n=1 Tax=Paramagnetospirillum magnetotacticum MS-1 TaxID=272627 RepID=A0A0C2YV12_PARME|nr:sigma-54 dependent transcriptional regulator [Paramagnetospirillum magnetotacticum]KIL98963.1 Hydrogenase transcriptional regulatory protein HoxA [Paramagnetospirillum magnetotacticum MS-1]
MTSLPIILVVDDEKQSQEALRRVLADEFQVLTASTAQEAEGLLEQEMVHAILCDQRMPGIQGVDFLKAVRDRWPDPVRMIISGYSEAEDIIAGVNEAGIYRYITKPWEPDELVHTLHGALKLYALQRENAQASLDLKVPPAALERSIAKKTGTLKRQHHFDSIIHASDSPLTEVIEMARKVSSFDISVLITGESGTGKELLARAIHYNSPRGNKPFVVENCGALPDQLLESELFGCKKGAFTGAYEDRIGLFEQASGGTIFLDEIGETSPAFQVKLLRVLQEGEIRPLGARLTRKVDVRVIAATNRNLEEEVREKHFRRDLFYRLAAFPIHLLPLRERPMDVPLLAERLLGDTARGFGRPNLRFAPDAVAQLQTYDWPGNVRELQNEIQRMVALADGPALGPDLLSPRLKSRICPAGRALADHGAPLTLKDQVEALEARLLAESLSRHRWNITRVAEETGLSRVGLRAKLRRYGLERED